MEFDLISFVVVMAVVAVAVTIDLRTRRIPNWLTVPAFAAGMLFHIVTGGWSGFLFAGGGFAVGFGILLALWLIGGGGGGDVKLMGAIGAWLGAPITLIIFFGSTIFSLVCTVAVIVWFRKPVPNSNATPTAAAVATNTTALKQTIPYALPVAMTVATLFLYFVLTTP